MKIGIIDYGVGNIGSVYNALKKLNFEGKIINNPSLIKNFNSLILPGVGNFTKSKKTLDDNGWSEAIIENVKCKGMPILGICLGMQLLAEFGTEGNKNDSYTHTKGLGLIQGCIEGLEKQGCDKRLPHMGWNSIFWEKESFFNKNIPNNTDFYFVHSYSFIPKFKDNVFASTKYSIPIVAVVGSDNIWGVQFHPEKSSKAGFQILKNFLDYSNA